MKVFRRHRIWYAIAAFFVVAIGIAAFWLWSLFNPYFVAKLEKRGLPLLEGSIPTFYSEGFKERASSIQSLMEEMLEFYRDGLQIETELHLAVLSRPDWEATTRLVPYGMPAVGGIPPIAGLPATPSGVVHESALSLKTDLSKELQEEIRAQGLTYEQAVDTFVDLIALHELGHHLADVYGIAPPAKWLDELLGTYFGYVFLSERKPGLQRIWDMVAIRAYIECVEPEHRSLGAFEELYFGVGVHNYGWYQAMFNQRVREICPDHGMEFLKALRREFPETEARPETEPGELLERLEKIAPGFEEWARRLDSAKRDE